MTEQHPILPSEELVKKWVCATGKVGYGYDSVRFYTYEQSIANQAARWGADLELEACCDYMQHEDFHGFARELRAARRPKPPSLKEQALAALSRLNRGALCANPTVDRDTIRRALEQLDD